MVWSGVNTSELCDIVLTVLRSTLRTAVAKDQATHTFKAGEIGVVYDDKGFVEEVSADGSARSKGIKKGDQIAKVRTEPFSRDTLVRAEKSGFGYEVTVKDSRLKPVASKLSEVCKLDADSRFPRKLTSTRAAVCRTWLDDAMELMRARSHPLAAPLAPVLRRLHWVPGANSLSTKVASADVVVTPELHVGVTLTAPHTQVPLHVTCANEVCLPLSDTMWEQNLRTLANPMLNRVPHEVGSAIAWEASDPHGVYTAEKPLLVIWMRYGDLASSPVLYEVPRAPPDTEELSEGRT